jgi:uncharacterized protein (DUF2342 family)
MLGKKEQLKRLIELYAGEHSGELIDFDVVAEWAIRKHGAVAPRPKTARELLAAEFAQVAREEHRRDAVTGLSYRRYHALKSRDNQGNQYTLWVELEKATRPQMHASLTNRRQQMVGDATQLKIDELVWNKRNPDKEPIQLVMDFNDDVEERLNAPGIDGQEAA